MLPSSLLLDPFTPLKPTTRPHSPNPSLRTRKKASTSSAPTPGLPNPEKSASPKFGDHTTYSTHGRSHLLDLLETLGSHIDGLKLAGGSFSLMLEAAVREFIDLAHQHGVYVSTCGWVEHVLLQPNTHGAVDKYVAKCKDLEFDVLECSKGVLSIPPDNFVRLVEKGGDTTAEDLEATGTSDPSKVVNLAKRFVKDLGVERVMIESECITENVKSWWIDVIQSIIRHVPSENVMFEAADSPVFNWYIREFGTDVNLFVDHSQIVQLACLGTGVWGMADTSGKVATYRG